MKTSVKIAFVLVVSTILLGYVFYILNGTISLAFKGVNLNQAQRPHRPMTMNQIRRTRLETLHIKPQRVDNKLNWKWWPTKIIDSPRHHKTASLTATPSLIENGGVVMVKWSNIPDPISRDKPDWLGLYCPSNATSDNFLYYWYISELSPGPNKGQGSAHFTLYNIREDCEFRYFMNVTKYIELVAHSNTIQFKGGKNAPLHGHLALTNNAEEIRVQWTTGVPYTPIVYYGTCDSGVLNLTARGTSKTYSNSDMCEPPANLSLHFVHPGYLHDVLLIQLQPNAMYCYKYGGAGRIFSEVKRFRSALPPGQATQFKFIVYGDMDTTPPPGGDTTAALVLREVVKNNAAFVLHNGDLSYAVGYAYRWDEWMTVMEPVSSRVPYMVTIGNHEQVHMEGGNKDPSHPMMGKGFHPEWGNYGYDSGGECGVPVTNRFHMPDNGNRVWWYSFEYGLVHFTQLSSENNFTRGSPQYTWLLQDLRSVDHRLTPWLIVTLHRPMYCSQKFAKDYKVSFHIRQELEDLFHQYDVDLVLAAHYHSYEHTCSVYKEKCVDDGITHIVVGTAGFPLDTAGRWNVEWSRYHEDEFGYGRITVANRSALQWEFIQNKNAKVVDSVWLKKD